MFNTLGFPVKPVIVIEPLLVVKVNCAFTTAGNSNTTTDRQIGISWRLVFIFRLSLLFRFPSPNQLFPKNRTVHAVSFVIDDFMNSASPAAREPVSCGAGCVRRGGR